MITAQIEEPMFMLIINSFQLFMFDLMLVNSILQFLSEKSREFCKTFEKFQATPYSYLFFLIFSDSIIHCH